MAVGKGKLDGGRLVPLSVKIGDIVLYKEYGGDEFKLNSEEVVVLKEEDILAIIEG